VHFHVDSDEDQLLLRAAGHFGSQQKALIAALHALNEVLALRRQVETLEQECERQRRLLAEAQALFRSS
jgi:cell division protein ZapA (FtsZ GTPase activity inhibitor)